MPTPAERRALLFVAAVAALGTGVRGLRALRAPDVPRSDREALATQIARVDSAIATGGRRPASRKSRETAVRAGSDVPPAATKPTASARADPHEALRRAPIDLDLADAASLDRLPGIGPALAARIVADRETNGPFASLDGLQRVKGVGPSLAARVAPFVTFSRAARQPPMVQDAHEVSRCP